MNINMNYFKKYVVTLIDNEGKIWNTIYNEKMDKSHWQPFSRIQDKMGVIFFSDIKEKETYYNVYNLPNIIAKYGYICICPLLVQKIENPHFTSYIHNNILICFPLKPSQKQLRSFKKFYKAFTIADTVSFFPKPDFSSFNLNLGNALRY